MPVKYFRMDTSTMSAEHRDELLASIRKNVGIGWWNMTEEHFIFRLRWNDDHDFLSLVRHSEEALLDPWELS